MKKSVGSFVALNRKAFLLLGVMLTVAVFGVVAWRTGAAPQANDSFGVSQAERKPVLTKKTELTRPGDQEKQPTGVISGASYKNDTSPPLRDMKPVPYDGDKEDHEASQNPKIPHPAHIDVPDPVVEDKLSAVQNLFFPTIPLPTLNFDGIAFPGVNCNCAPPDTNGEVGLTQYVQMVNKGYQVYNKSTGASVFGPVDLFTIWAGFGGACENGGSGDPIVLYDQIANRWIISQFATAAGGTPITDECIAVSTSNDATGSFNRYGFHLGTNFFDYPHIAVWPDGYYMSDNVFNAAGTVYLGPQPFAFDRTRMLAGLSATFLTTPALGNTDPILPADLDGSILPTAGAPETFVGYPGQATPQYTTYHFHADFGVPANSTFTTFAMPAAAGFTILCPLTRACVPELGGVGLNGMGDRPMFRLAYRKFADGHEAVVGNYSVSSGGVAAPRWFELRGGSAGFQPRN